MLFKIDDCTTVRNCSGFFCREEIPTGIKKWWHSLLGAVGPGSQPKVKQFTLGLSIDENQEKNLVCRVFVATLASWLKNGLLDSFELLKSRKNWQICSSLKFVHYKHAPYKSIFDFTFSPNKNYQTVVIVQRHCNFCKFRYKTLSSRFCDYWPLQMCLSRTALSIWMINLPQHDI